MGAVSRAPLAGHPDYTQMSVELNRGSRDELRDAGLRANAQMYLYESLRQVQKYQPKG